MRRFIRRFGAAAILGAALVAAGCGDSSKGPAPTAAGEKKAKPKGHAHEGPHDGAVAEWGDDEYHVEFTVDHAAQEATVYVLDGDANRASPIEATTLTLTLKLAPPVTVTLAAKPQEGDPPGRSSRFVGKHPALGKVQEFSGTISGQAGGKPYSGDFAEEPHADHKGKKSSKADGPTKREVDLFLKPGGIYTSADITKNGNVVPSEKFRGFEWSHDDDLKSGDKVCPVTVNKADEKCGWWVNGQLYEFCCPPCLEKFVKWAKESPEKIKDPGAYRKQ
jgi:hypothetical protein